MSHPILDATGSIDAALKSVTDVNPTFMSTDDKARALSELVRVESRLTELRLRILADASDLAEQTASHDAAEWLAVQTRIRHEDARADLTLARALDRRWNNLARALRDGEATVVQARIVARALDDLPQEIPAEVVARAEQTLVVHAAAFGPRQLARLARHIVDVVAPEIAEATEARRLAALEQEAHRKTRLTLRRRGDGTTRISGLIPDHAATRLATYLEAFTNPRKQTAPAADPMDRLPYPRRLGEAFVRLLESTDPKRLPLHGGDATTVIVTISLDQLREELATAGIIASHVPGDDDDQLVTAAEARRLACTANIVPAVLGGGSEILDLGRTRRLFSPAQRKALLLRDKVCRGEHCTIPGTWCEAHHWLDWASGGNTDLDDGVLLCQHHHHRIHDPRYTAERLPNGDVRFYRRT